MSKDLRKRIFLAGIFLLIVTATGTTGYYLMGHFAQGSSPWRLTDCFYMTVITLTTVGFGEVIDLTHVPGGRLFTILFCSGESGWPCILFRP